MEAIFDFFFHIIVVICRFILMNIILEIIVEIVFRSTGYVIVRCYRYGQSVDFDSTEVVLVGFFALLVLILLSIYCFLR